MSSPANELVWPLQVDPASGRFLSTTDLALQTKMHVAAVVGTEPGERVMRASYGTSTLEFLFSPLNDIETEAVKQRIIKAVSAQCPEVGVNGVDVDVDEQSGRAMFTVRYRLANDTQQAATITTALPTN